ncbi:MAG: glycerate kinase [Bacteroides nordii]
MKKIILAFDSFKGSANSLDIARVAKEAILKEYPLCNVITFPIADGGEGTTEAICTGLNVDKVSCSVHDPLMAPIDVTYGITKDGTTAVLEMAAASGLPLIPDRLRNPMNTSTYGTGEVILDALNKGCRHFIMGLGGSATNDAAIGLLSALGVRFLDNSGNILEPKGSNLIHITSIDDSLFHPAIKESFFTLACDVNNPFYGPQGAAFVYAPQKGASQEEVVALDKGLRHYAAIIKKQKGMDISSTPGAGAAGGMGGGLLPFLQATLKPGINTILDILHFRESLQDADLVFTGEGKLDAQTAMGKALGGVLKTAREQHVPVIALGGGVESSALLNKMGFTAVLPIQPTPVSLDKAMQKEFTLDNIGRTVTQLIRIIQCFNPTFNH